MNYQEWFNKEQTRRQLVAECLVVYDSFRYFQRSFCSALHLIGLIVRRHTSLEKPMMHIVRHTVNALPETDLMYLN
jgi:hypothetical protein